MLDVPEGLFRCVLLVLSSLWGCWGETVGPRNCGGDVPLCVPWMSHCVADSCGIQAFSCHQGLSIMLEREEPPPIMGTRFSWGQQEQLGMGATLVW